MNTTERLSIIDEDGKIKAITIDIMMSLGDVVVTNLESTPKPTSLTDRIGLSNINLITQIRSQSIGYSHAHNGSLNTVLVVSTRGRSYCIHREVESFYHILRQSQRRVSAILAQDCVIPSVQIPVCPISTSTDDAAIVLWCTEMNQFLTEAWYLQGDLAWLRFIQDNNSRTNTTIEFILQALPMEAVYIPRGSWHEIKLNTDIVENTAVWRFVVGDHDIEFSVTFTPKGEEESVAEIVHERTRYVADDKKTPIEGIYQTGAPGTVILIWNNSFSRIRGKNITFQAQVVAGEVLESAKEAADALDETNSSILNRESSRGDALALDVRRSPELDARPPNYPSLQYLAALGTGWIGQVPFSVAHRLGIGGNGFMQRNEAAQKKELICISDLDKGTSVKDILCKKIMDRLENLEDQVATLRVERDQACIRVELVNAHNHKLRTEATEQENVLKAMQSDLQRLQHEQIVWKDNQMERDRLLEEKHHWESADEFAYEGDKKVDLNLDESTIKALEKELGVAEATVLRLRAQLGYSLSNRLSSHSRGFEQMTQEVLHMRQLLQSSEQRRLDEFQALHKKATKYRSQKIFLAKQLKRLQFQAQEQIAIALAEASEARMAYKRLHTQKELLLAQVETLIQVKRVTDDSQSDRPSSPRLDESRSVNVAFEPSTSVPYTLVEEDVALLQGEVCLHQVDTSCRGHTASSQSHRDRLIAFLRKYDPTRIGQVDEMLQNYRGVELLLFESLQLKYQLSNSGTVD